MQVFIRA